MSDMTREDWEGLVADCGLRGAVIRIRDSGERRTGTIVRAKCDDSGITLDLLGIFRGEWGPAAEWVGDGTWHYNWAALARASRAGYVITLDSSQPSSAYIELH